MRRTGFILALLVSTPAIAHDWYPWRCCSGMDCKLVPIGTVTPSDTGWYVNTTQETIPYNDKRIEQSPDGEFHQCAKGANFAPGGKTLCLFVPNQGA